MKKILIITLAFVFSSGSVWAQAPLPITQVLLYKNGMAYIVRSGRLDAPLSLTFHPDDMNDVLKTFTAWNPDTGALYSVGYTTGIPSSHMLGRFPFDISGPTSGLAGFLAQVKGADVRLDLAAGPLEGKIVTVQPVQRAIGDSLVPDHQVTLLLATGSVRTVWLSDVRALQFADLQLREQLRSYLEILAEGRQDVTRDISVYPVPSSGPIRVAYLQQFPLWKTSYRLDLNAEGGILQGWAQIDNPTGEAWDNVEVSLLSGMPVSFLMNLYDPIYTNRTSVAVPGGVVAAPREYEVGILAQALETSAANARVGAAAGNGVPGGVIGSAIRDGLSVTGGAFAAPPPAPAAPLQISEAEALQIHDFFEYRFPSPVRLASRQSALLPFLNRSIGAERLSIFNARTDRNNPRAGAMLENNSGVPLEAGPMTFFQDGRYAGEAVVQYVARAEKRLVSYGIDYDTQIASAIQNQPETTSRVTVDRGIVVVTRETVQHTNYEIRNKGAEAKVLIVEHPRQADRTLRDLDPWETTENFYRFRLELAPNQERTFPVSEIISRQTSISLGTLTREQLAAFVGNETPQEIRQRLGAIVDVRDEIGRIQSELAFARERTDALFRDQERLRENLRSLGTSGDDRNLRSRYLDQLTQQEDEVDQLRTRTDALNRELADVQARMSTMISTLTWQG